MSILDSISASGASWRGAQGSDQGRNTYCGQMFERNHNFNQKVRSTRHKDIYKCKMFKKISLHHVTSSVDCRGGGEGVLLGKSGHI